MSGDYISVTEIAGDEVTGEQIVRLGNRYYWAGCYCAGKDVVEAACGTGQGLGYLAGIDEHWRDNTEFWRTDKRTNGGFLVPKQSQVGRAVLFSDRLEFLGLQWSQGSFRDDRCQEP